MTVNSNIASNGDVTESCVSASRLISFSIVSKKKLSDIFEQYAKIQIQQQQKIYGAITSFTKSQKIFCSIGFYFQNQPVSMKSEFFFILSLNPYKWTQNGAITKPELADNKKKTSSKKEQKKSNSFLKICWK